MRGLCRAIAIMVLGARAAAAHPPPPPPPLRPPFLVPAPELDGRHALGLGFGLGGLELGDTGGLLAPIFHGRYALVFAPFELELTGDWSGWGDAKGDPEDPNLPRRVMRVGTAVRWDFALLDHSNPDVATMFYADAGMGWEHATSARAAADRGDLEVGVGMEELFLWSGHARAGFDVSFHFIGAPATDGFARVACHAICTPTGRGLDLGMTYTIGLVLRR